MVSCIWIDSPKSNSFQNVYISILHSIFLIPQDNASSIVLRISLLLKIVKKFLWGNKYSLNDTNCEKWYKDGLVYSFVPLKKIMCIIIRGLCSFLGFISVPRSLSYSWIGFDLVLDIFLFVYEKTWSLIWSFAKMDFEGFLMVMNFHVDFEQSLVMMNFLVGYEHYPMVMILRSVTYKKIWRRSHFY